MACKIGCLLLTIAVACSALPSTLKRKGDNNDEQYQNWHGSPHQSWWANYYDGFGSNGYAPSGFGQRGFGSSGFGQNGFGQSGFGPSGFGQNGFGPSSFGQSGFGPSGFYPSIYKPYGAGAGFQTNGLGQQGFNSGGFGPSAIGYGVSHGFGYGGPIWANFKPNIHEGHEYASNSISGNGEVSFGHGPDGFDNKPQKPAEPPKEQDNPDEIKGMIQNNFNIPEFNEEEDRRKGGYWGYTPKLPIGYGGFRPGFIYPMHPHYPHIYNQEEIDNLENGSGEDLVLNESSVA